jgi:hypothetical protein
MIPMDKPTWQTMDSAPRDGSDFQVHLENGYITRGRYTMNGRLFACDVLFHDGHRPTHWQPLPEPPPLN